MLSSLHFTLSLDDQRNERVCVKGREPDHYSIDWVIEWLRYRTPSYTIFMPPSYQMSSQCQRQHTHFTSSFTPLALTIVDTHRTPLSSPQDPSHLLQHFNRYLPYPLPLPFKTQLTSFNTSSSTSLWSSVWASLTSPARRMSTPLLLQWGECPDWTTVIREGGTIHRTNMQGQIDNFLPPLFYCTLSHTLQTQLYSSCMRVIIFAGCRCPNRQR